MVRRPEPLLGYVRGCVLGGAVVLLSLGVVGFPTLHDIRLTHLLLAAALLPSEMLPIVLSRRGKATDSLTMSSTYAFALVLTAPLLFTVIAQCLAVGIDDTRRGCSRMKVAWNVSQYVITLALSRLVFAVVDHRGVLSDSRALDGRGLIAVLAAAATYFLINNGMTGIVVALADRQPIVSSLLEDVRFRLSIFGVLLGLGPVVVQALALSPVLLLVIFFALAAVRSSAALALSREHEALHDPLTGLPNRVKLLLECASAVTGLAGTERRVALLMIDLDHFKEVNDTLGHNSGDALIREVGHRLRASVPADWLVARLGGDEFAVLVPVVSSVPALAREADRLLRELGEPYVLDSVRLSVGASIGIAVAPDDAADAAALVQRADVALYKAKESRGGVSLYDSRSDEHSVSKLSMLTELREGIDRGELELHYQPQCESETGLVSGFEALVRWRHPVRGLLYPDAFLLAAETTSIIDPLTLEVLRQGLVQLATWSRAGLDVVLSVNISARQLSDLDLVAAVQRLLQEHRVPSHRLVLEVTESAVMADASRTIGVLQALSRLGVGLSIDDFGTGYSSLAYLTRLGADELKIDRSFVVNMVDNPDDATVVKSIVELGHNLGMRVVAEGVETVATATRLAELGCDIIQGYLHHRPMPAAQVEPWLRTTAGHRFSAPRLAVAEGA